MKLDGWNVSILVASYSSDLNMAYENKDMPLDLLPSSRFSLSLFGWAVMLTD